jgi:hypothetical protein
MNVRASFWVSKVGTIVSSSGAALGLDPGVGMSVCAWIVVASAKSDVIHKRPAFLINVILSEAKNLGSFSRLKHSDKQRCFASLNMTDSSMVLQKALHFLRQFAANSLGGCDLVNSCLAQAVHGAEPPQQKILPVLAHSGTIVEDAFFNSFFHEQLVICVGKPVRLIADALKQSQGRGIHWQSQR